MHSLSNISVSDNFIRILLFFIKITSKCMTVDPEIRFPKSSSHSESTGRNPKTTLYESVFLFFDIILWRTKCPRSIFHQFCSFPHSPNTYFEIIHIPHSTSSERVVFTTRCEPHCKRFVQLKPWNTLFKTFSNFDPLSLYSHSYNERSSSRKNQKW